MAVAFAQTQPWSFVGAEVVEHSTQISSHMSAESFNDSDDDYDYVATLAEQIAHAMLDDDDCQEDAFSREQEIIGSRSPFRKNVFSKIDLLDSTRDSWFCNSNLSSKIFQGRTSPLSPPFYLHSSPLFSRNHGHTKIDDRRNGREGITRASSPGEGAQYATLAGSENHSGVRERLSHLTRQSNVAALPLMSTSPPVTEIFSLPAMVSSTETIANAPKFPSQQTYSDGMSHMRQNHASLEWQYRGVPCSNGGSRNIVGRRHRTSRDDKGARAGHCRYSVQASRRTSLQSLPLEVADRTGVHAVVMGYGSGQKEKIGTGVFLPRAHSTSSNHRRKSDGGLKMSKTVQVPKNIVEETKVNISRHRGEYLRKSNIRTEWTH